MPCDYRFQWISIENGKRVKRQMWGCTRLLSSYNSGLWIDRYVQALDNVTRAILPLNSISQSFGYLKENGENQRLIVSAKTDFPTTWKVSKVDNTSPIGLLKVTFKEDNFNPNTDYIEKDDNGDIIGMWADYYDTNFSPINPGDDDPEPKPYNHCLLSSSNFSLRNGGRYKTITSTYLNMDEVDISSEYSDKDKEYFFEIDGEDVKDYITYEIKDDKNIIKIKFNNSDYIGKFLIVRTLIDYIWGEIKLEII